MKPATVFTPLLKKNVFISYKNRCTLVDLAKGLYGKSEPEKKVLW